MLRLRVTSAIDRHYINDRNEDKKNAGSNRRLCNLSGGTSPSARAVIICSD